MQLSVVEAATVLGKSPRQIRYMIRQGQLEATREGKQWRIEGDSLPLGEAQRRALQERLEKARETFDHALDPVSKALEGSAGCPDGRPNARGRAPAAAWRGFQHWVS